MNTLTRHAALAALWGLSMAAQAQIRINQVGLLPAQEKIAVVEGSVGASQIRIVDAQTGKTAARAKVLRVAKSPFSERRRTVVDFSSLSREGEYLIKAGKNHSQPFRIGRDALREVACGALKAFYLVRSGMPIEAQYAGPWARPAGHADTLVYVHASAASPGRPEGTAFSSPGGWYDAGDYNKYVVNSSYSIGLMLCAYQQARQAFGHLSTDIPESRNTTADLLDELMYNLSWLLTMQDPWDGGVYHKLTTPDFEGFVMPGACRQPRYVVQKSTAATLDFAAVMAQAARIYKHCADYPQFSARAERAALAAYHWAGQHPDSYYVQQEMNRRFQPAVNTGDYGDLQLADEWYWAATELYLLTGDDKFQRDARQHLPAAFAPSSWAGVAALGTYEWLSNRPQASIAQTVGPQLMAYCDSLTATTALSSFQTPSGNRADDFGWGCLGGSFCSSGVALLFAHQLSGLQKYLTAAQQNVDYVLGRNALGLCYVTGFGKNSPLYPHHRISAADNVEKPVPGLLVGGPNPGQQDREGNHVDYPSDLPDESYTDNADSYASNEIAINWNAELVSLLGWLHALSQ